MLAAGVSGPFQLIKGAEMELTKEQEQAVKEAIGDGSDWPSATGDPRVNHRVDQLVSSLNKEIDLLPDWDLLEEEEREAYIEEAKLLLRG